MEETGKTNKTKKARMILGISMFTLGCAFYSFYCLVFKLALFKFEISVAEFSFMISCWALPMFYLAAKFNKQDVLLIPGKN